MEYEQIKKIINDMSQSSLNSLNIEFPDGVKINITKDSNGNNSVVDTKAITNNISAIVNEKTNAETIEVENNIVKSPMVGTCYLKPAPDKEEFVKVGDIVKKGQVLCIIEAMKLMNEIESEYDGTIVEICTGNEEMVDYGKPLFRIK